MKKIIKIIKQYSKIIILVINSVILTFVYFIGIGFTFLIKKITKKRLFNLDKNEKTYWEDRKEEKKSLNDFYNPF
jgi:hypothetical protein